MRGYPCPNPRLLSPLPRRDIIAICAFLNRAAIEPIGQAVRFGAETDLDRLAAAARMQ